MATFVRTLQSTYFPSLRPYNSITLWDLDLDVTRGSDFRLISQAVFIIQKFSESNGTAKGIRSAGTITQVEKWLSSEADITTELKEAANGTFTVFTKILENEGLKNLAGFYKRVSPIEFIFISLLISVNRDEMKLEELCKSIGDMRIAVRAVHKDVRMNNKVATTLFTFLEKMKSTGGRKTGCGSKRKREVEDMDSAV
jgi:hypothetical protein